MLSLSQHLLGARAASAGDIGAHPRARAGPGGGHLAPARHGRPLMAVGGSRLPGGRHRSHHAPAWATAAAVAGVLGLLTAWDLSGERRAPESGQHGCRAAERRTCGSIGLSSTSNTD